MRARGSRLSAENQSCCTALRSAGDRKNGKILLDHYCCKRRRSAGDERVCHRPVTRMPGPSCMRGDFGLAYERTKRQAPAPLGGTIAPEPGKVTACPKTRCLIFLFQNRSSATVTSSWFRQERPPSPFLSTAPAVPTPCVLTRTAVQATTPGRAICRRALFPHASNDTRSDTFAGLQSAADRCDG